VSPEAHSTPNSATMSPADASWMSSSSSECMRTRRGTCGFVRGPAAHTVLNCDAVQC
jgi:hypothetical protein